MSISYILSVISSSFIKVMKNKWITVFTYVNITNDKYTKINVIILNALQCIITSNILGYIFWTCLKRIFICNIGTDKCIVLWALWPKYSLMRMGYCIDHTDTNHSTTYTMTCTRPMFVMFTFQNRHHIDVSPVHKD